MANSAQYKHLWVCDNSVTDADIVNIVVIFGTPPVAQQFALLHRTEHNITMLMSDTRLKALAKYLLYGREDL